MYCYQQERIHNACLANSIGCPLVLSLGLVYNTLVSLTFDPLCVCDIRGFLCNVLGNLPPSCICRFCFYYYYLFIYSLKSSGFKITASVHRTPFQTPNQAGETPFLPGVLYHFFPFQIQIYTLKEFFSRS